VEVGERMLQMRNKKKLLIEEEKKIGVYHVQLLKASGEVEQDLFVSPDFFAQALFGNFNPQEVSAPEVKSLRWLANMFPYTEHPEDEADKITNAIHVYTTAGANKIEMLQNIIGMKMESGKL
jgi:hypothetical protein